MGIHERAMVMLPPAQLVAAAAAAVLSAGIRPAPHLNPRLSQCHNCSLEPPPRMVAVSLTLLLQESVQTFGRKVCCRPLLESQPAGASSRGIHTRARVRGAISGNHGERGNKPPPPR